MARPSKFSPEAMNSIADKIGCSAETLRKWVRRAEIDTGAGPGGHQLRACAAQGVGAGES